MRLPGKHNAQVLQAWQAVDDGLDAFFKAVVEGFLPLSVGYLLIGAQLKRESAKMDGEAAVVRE